MTFTSFNKSNAQQIQNAIVRSFTETFGNTNGVKISIAGGSVGSSELILKFKFTVTDTLAKTKNEKEMFDAFCYQYGLTPKHYNARFVHTGTGSTYELFGFAPSRYRFPFRARDIVTGKEMFFTHSIVNRLKIQEA